MAKQRRSAVRGSYLPIALMSVTVMGMLGLSGMAVAWTLSGQRQFDVFGFSFTGILVDAFDLVSVDSKIMIVSDASLAMATTCFSITTLMVADPETLRFVLLNSKPLGKTDAADHHIGCPANLFNRQSFSVGDDLCSA